jgi:hypothetical protein
LSRLYPGALVILSVRDPDEWFTSCTNTIFGGMRMRMEHGDAWMAAMLRLLATRFCDRLDDRDAMIAAFHRHNDRVRDQVPAKRLLEWTPADGWEPLCERLGMAVPAEPFPRVNSTADFRVGVGLPPLKS